MAVDGMLRIFNRSEKLHNLKYSNYIGDGDTKTFNALSENKPYGDDYLIQKIECVGHVQKRMGTRLRKLILVYSKKKLSDGKTIGGKGRLTDSLIDKLAHYYGNAIRCNSTSVKEMRKAIWAVWGHSCSTDDEPMHWFCPTNPNTWYLSHPALLKKCLEKNNFKELADYAISESVRIIKSKGWKEETRIGEDVIYSKTVPNIGKVFKYEGIVDIEAEKINNKLFYNVEKSTEWNNNIEKVDVVETIDNRTNVVHFISKSRLFVSSRDFVHLRAWKKKDDAIIHSSFSINHPKAPPSSYIRAEHRFCTYIISPSKMILPELISFGLCKSIS
ncbi:steroidogenic acute regulatory protein, mitochondrial, partial [Trichonephila clavipes]